MPRPAAPGTRIVIECPRRVASNASRSPRRWASRPTSERRTSEWAAVGTGRLLVFAPRRRRISGPVGLSRGSRLRSAQQSASRSAGTSRTHSPGAIGSSVLLVVITSTAVPENGGRPTSDS